MSVSIKVTIETIVCKEEELNDKSRELLKMGYKIEEIIHSVYQGLFAVIIYSYTSFEEIKK